MRLTIFQRLMAGYMAIMFLVISFGGYIVFQLNLLTQITHLAAGVDSEVILSTESLSTKLQTLLSLEKKYWISGDRDFYQLFQKRRHEFLEQLNGLKPLTSGTELDPLLQDSLTFSESYFKGVEDREAQAGVIAAPTTYESRRDGLVRVLLISLDQIHRAGNLARDEKIRTSEEVSRKVLRVTIGFAVGYILLGLMVSLITTQTIVRPIVVFQHKTRDIGAGHFVTIEKLRAPPEILQLAAEFNTMSERLKELDTLKEDFVSHVSHTLRTPLTAIREASELLIAGTVDRDPERRFQLLTIVRDECKRLIVSVNRILDLSRMESNMMEYQFVETDLNAAIQTVVSRLSPIAQGRKVALRFTLRPDLPPVLADTEQLHQLLENLIGNAIKFTAAEGSVALEILPQIDAEGKIRVCVADTGCGIEPAHLESIFQKFRRIEKGKDTNRGTGLGLAIAKHIVTAHGGSIWVESEKGKGSTFFFSLPPA